MTHIPSKTITASRNWDAHKDNPKSQFSTSTETDLPYKSEKAGKAKNVKAKVGHTSQDLQQLLLLFNHLYSINTNQARTNTL
ncbi:MAG: hypothetical protein SGJ10_07385 [Bacteroidota bacterium]|nr:hypothetical protein [Bacteroidota bacterium]